MTRSVLLAPRRSLAVLRLARRALPRIAGLNPGACALDLALERRRTVRVLVALLPPGAGAQRVAGAQGAPVEGGAEEPRPAGVRNVG